MNGYYIVEHAIGDQEGIFPQLPQRIIGSDRQPFQMAGPIESGLVRDKLHVYYAGTAFLEVRPSRRLADLLTYMFCGTIIVREDVVEEMDRQGLVIGDGTFRWLLEIVEPTSHQCWSRFRILWPLKAYDVLDLQRSKIEYYSDGRTVSRVIEWVLDPLRVPCADLFASPYKTWLCTERFRQFVSSRKYSGFRFSALHSSASR